MSTESSDVPDSLNFKIRLSSAMLNHSAEQSSSHEETSDGNYSQASEPASSTNEGGEVEKCKKKEFLASPSATDSSKEMPSQSD